MPACFSDLYYYTTMDYEDDPDEADEGGECYAAIQSRKDFVRGVGRGLLRSGGTPCLE